MKRNSLILLSFLLWTFSTNAADAPKIGLALSGGGARGLSHIGVLQALEELRIPITYLSGTSMGGLVAGLYASGLTTQELKEAATGGIDWKKVFSTVPPHEELSLRDKQQLSRFIPGLEVGLSSEQLISSGFLGGQELFLTLHRYTRGIEVPDFNQLPIPFKCVATDINKAEPVVLEKGNLAMALRATMSVPFAFSPIEIDNQLLVDGGILNNLPIDVARKMGANVVIAINISSPVGKADQSSSFVTVALQSVDIALVQNTLQSLQSIKNSDILIQPDIDEFTSSDFEKAEILIQRGYDAIMGKSWLFTGLALSEEEYQGYRQMIEARKPQGEDRNIQPAFIDFKGNKRTEKKLLASRLDNLESKTLNVGDLENITRHLTRLNDISQVTYRITENEKGEKGVLFDVDEKSWGPHYLKLGINATTGFDRRADFNTLIRHSYLNATPYGGEWINELKLGNEYYYFTEFYQPLDYQGKFFVAPHFKLQRRFVDIYEQTSKIAKASYLVQGYRAGIDVGMNISNRAEIRLGMRYVSDTPRLQAGENNLYPETGFHEPALTFSYLLDSSNARLFATKGSKIKLQGEFHDKSFGAKRRYSLLSLNAAHYFTPNFSFNAEDHRYLIKKPQITFEGRIFVASSFGTEPPPHDYFSLGGTLLLAGYPQYSMMGSEAIFGQIGAFLNPDFIAPLKSFSDVRLFASLHTGKAWMKPEHIKLQNLLTGGLGGLVWDTNFGNVFFGMGYTQGGDVRYLFSLGNEF